MEKGGTGELWLVRRLLGRTFALLYEPFLLSVDDIRAGRGKLTSDDYAGAVVALLYLSAAARGVLGLLSAGVFAVLATVSIGFGYQAVWDLWLDEIALVLGWAAALGALTSLVRHGLVRVFRGRESTLIRTGLAEPARGDIVWQVVVAAWAAVFFR